MSAAVVGLLLVLSGWFVGAIVGYFLLWWIIGHNPLHKGRCP